MKCYKITNQQDAINFMSSEDFFAYIFASDGTRLGDVLGGNEIMVTNEYDFIQQFFSNANDAWQYIIGRIVENPILIVPL